MDRILLLFGIAPKQKKDVLLICSPFVIAVISIVLSAFVICLLWLYFTIVVKTIKNADSFQNSFVASLAVISNMLVIANTFIFVFTSSQITIKTPKNNSTKRSNTLLSFYNILNMFTLVVAIISLVLFFGVFKYSEHVISASSIIIFILFIISDKLFIKYLDDCIKQEKDENSIEEFNVQKGVMKRVLALIDLAGLFGTIVILLILIIFNTFADKSFIQGFGIGALAFHIIFTQFNWAYLKTDELIKIQNIEYRIKPSCSDEKDFL